MDDQGGKIFGSEQQVGAEWDPAAGNRDLSASAVAGDEVARLVELAVVGQVDFRHHPQKLAAMDRQSAVVECAAVSDRRADQQHWQEVGGGLDQRIDRRLDAVEQRGLLQQIADGVSGNAEFREHGQRHPLAIAVLRQLQDRCGVGGGVGQRGARGARGNPGEAVTVERAEAHGSNHRGL